MANEETSEERNFSFKNFWGQSSITPHVEYKRNNITYCIYCGAEADTREHCPSKVFLRKPYPDNLYILPACKSCNNSFSDDELYAEIYIDALKHLSGYSPNISCENQERIYKNTAFYDAQKDYVHFLETNKLPLNDKLLNILTKLSIGHLIYELSFGYAVDNKLIKPVSLRYYTSFNIPKELINDFDSPIDMTDKLLPELGSRAFENIYVFESVLREYSENNQQIIQFPIMVWTVSQPNQYQYITWIEDNQHAHVRIIIHDFLYAEIIYTLD